MQKALVWVRRDLRLTDHTPLAHAASQADTVAVAFVFDRKLLAGLSRNDRRLTFIHQSLEELDEELQKRGSRLIVRIGDPVEEIPQLAKELGAELVCAGRDYETYAKKRDAKVAEALKKQGSQLKLLKDQVIFEGREVLSKTGTAFKVFTPYKNAWLSALSAQEYDERSTKKAKFAPKPPKNPDWSLKALGFDPQDLWLEAGEKAAKLRLKSFEAKMKDYGKGRDFPATEGTSGLSVHLRFGTISIRECVRKALAQENAGAKTWLSELVWRDFYHMILDNNPHVETGAFKKEYDSIRWPGSEKHFQAWSEGRTGYPLVDAAMRHFNATGWMHNRLRMVVASFLTKDLLVSWQKGEAYFAQHLLDFDLAANNGGWQWSASTGCDAQPYFRIFNPYSQSEKFDPDGTFIRENVPELAKVKGKDIHQPEVGGLFGVDYPEPIVDHSAQREKAIRLFKK